MSALSDILPCRKPDEKIGLALSGGGFRAAFFHVGVLARLAEIGVLPKIEVISTVSGGSIVGAAYYIRLRRLLNSKADDQISADDYVKLVDDIAERLHDAVSKNIRGRLLANPLKNLEMLFSPRYSRSDRIGDLYDRYLYKGAWQDQRAQRSAFREEQIEMRELLVEPGGDSGFDPSTGNPTRRAKVPVLLINATTLNTGHNWRFEATRMGEPLPDDERRAEIVTEVDANMRLAQAYFPRKNPKPTDPEVPKPHVPEKQQGFPLALAVAASACVPGAFLPLAISGMYWDEDKPVRVRLVDGGVQDNQGVQALLDRDCNRLIVSDSSGQLKDKRKPRTWLPLSLARSASIEGDRIRDEQLTHLPAEGRKYALMHLRKGLKGKAIPPAPAGDEAAAPTSERHPEYDTTAFGVDADVQRALSEIRTDLDFFSQTETLSLELDGYLMSRKELELRGFDALGDPQLAPGKTDWDFLAMADKIGTKDPGYLGKLKAGRHLFLRLLWLKPALALVMALLGLLVAAATIAAACTLDAVGASWPLTAAGAVVLVFLAISLWSNVSGWTARRYES